MSRLVRATQNYEDRKEKWLVQVASDHSLPPIAVRVAIVIGLHMNRKQRLLAWPGYGRLATLLGTTRKMAIKGAKALERAGHMRVVRSRNGTKNNPNHYHPNIWATMGVVPKRILDSPQAGTRVVPRQTPEPMNEPTKEPTIRNINGEDKIGGRGSGGIPDSLGQPKPQWSTPTVEEITATAEANLAQHSYAAALGSFRPVISRFDKARRLGDRT
jgi:hypothetical protein